MDKLLFTPIGIAAGIAAGFAGRLAFDRVWALIDDQEPPEPEHRDISVVKMVAALAIQGAIFRAVRGIAEHQARRGFQRWTGAWPGEKRPEPE
ncbi:MAG: DUF4235 domain-containing protein [Actinomycetota bacterium]|nr:DUF4235 domain-containing protein [Actinomycetota bacterium]